MMEDNGISTKISMVRSGSLHTLTTPSNSEQNHQPNREMKPKEKDRGIKITNVESDKQCSISVVSGCDSIKTTWDIRECFKQLRFNKSHHLGLGDIRLTIAQQEEICDLVEQFYHCR